MRNHPHRITHLLPETSLARANEVLETDPKDIQVATLVCQMNFGTVVVTTEDIHFYVPQILEVLSDGVPRTIRMISKMLGIKTEVVRKVLRARKDDFMRLGARLYLPKITMSNVLDVVASKPRLRCHELAAKFGVSNGHMSRLLKNLQDQGTIGVVKGDRGASHFLALRAA